MFELHNSALSVLKDIKWEEGKVETCTIVGSYRHAVTVVCSSQGRRRAMFKNGEHPYFAYVDLIDGNGNWISRGNNIVPVLPDGRLLMVIEQRPSLARYPDHPKTVVLNNRQKVDLGEYGSLEFPGGAVEPGEAFTASFLRELTEETGVTEQWARVIRRVPLVYPFSSDIALAMSYAVVFLENVGFENHVKNDGGLDVLALWPYVIHANIQSGAIAGAQVALIGWNFFQEVQQTSPDELVVLVERGYLSVERVRVVTPR